MPVAPAALQFRRAPRTIARNVSAGMEDRMQCLVTGASGFIGRALVSALTVEGNGVSVQVHRGAAPPGATDVLRLDLRDGVPPATLDGIEVVYHLAAIAHRHAADDDYAALNVDATVALWRAAAARGVRRFVFLSSVKAGVPDIGARDESPYARSKRAAEQALMERAAAAGPDLVIVRPALVYGAGAGGYLHWLQRWSAARLPAPPPGGERSMVARDDLVRVLCAVAAVSTCPSAPLIVTDGQAYCARRLLQALNGAAGRRPLLPAPPAALWRVAGAVADRLSGAPRGSTWRRLQAAEAYRASDLAALCGVAPRLCFEDVARSLAASPTAPQAGSQSGSQPGSQPGSQ
jgi:UDP-glucose 4-epimerase